MERKYGYWALPGRTRRDSYSILYSNIQCAVPDFAGFCDKFSGECLPNGKCSLGYLSPFFSLCFPYQPSILHLHQEFKSQLLIWFHQIVHNELLSICAAINASNSPLLIFTMKAAPALTASNALISKASEMNPLSTLLLGSLAIEAGVVLSSHVKSRKINFTDSVAVGKKIQVAATNSNLKRVTLELGGKRSRAVDLVLITTILELDQEYLWLIHHIFIVSFLRRLIYTRAPSNE